MQNHNLINMEILKLLKQTIFLLETIINQNLGEYISGEDFEQPGNNSGDYDPYGDPYDNPDKSPWDNNLNQNIPLFQNQQPFDSSEEICCAHDSCYSEKDDTTYICMKCNYGKNCTPPHVDCSRYCR